MALLIFTWSATANHVRSHLQRAHSFVGECCCAPKKIPLGALAIGMPIEFPASPLTRRKRPEEGLSVPTIRAECPFRYTFYASRHQN